LAAESVFSTWAVEAVQLVEMPAFLLLLEVVAEAGAVVEAVLDKQAQLV
jgi:hypothetical protein